MNERVCRICRTRQHVEHFSKYFHKQANRFYRRTFCKSCHSVVSRNYRKIHRVKCNARAKRYEKTHPWLRTLRNIRQRCNDPNRYNFKYYGAKNIQARISARELKVLWFRDKAYLMKRASIDRIDPTKNYTFDNCRYMEYEENIKRRGRGNNAKN